MYPFDPAPFTQFDDIVYYVVLYSVTILGAVAFLFISRGNVSLPALQSLVSTTASRITLLGLAGFSLIALRLGEAPWLSMPLLHIVPVCGVLWQCRHYATRRTSLIQSEQKRVASKEARNALVKNTDPYLSAHQRKKKSKSS